MGALWKLAIAIVGAVALVVAVGFGRQGEDSPAASSDGPEGRSASFVLDPGKAARRAPPSIGANHPAWAARDKGVKVVPSAWEGYARGDEVYLSTGAGWCTGFREPWLQRVDVLEVGRRVILTAYVAYPPPHVPGFEASCGAVEIELNEELDLPRPVGAREVLDGVQWPPLKRWPL